MRTVAGAPRRRARPSTLDLIPSIQGVPRPVPPRRPIMMAFDPQAVGGGVLGTITVSVMNSMRYGVARGCFSNEAGLGSAAITAEPQSAGASSMD